MEDLSRDDVTVLGWVIPRPTGRWHQSIVITARHVWITPELAFTKNEQLLAAAAAGIDAFHDHVKTERWTPTPQRCYLADITGLKWNALTGWMRIAASKEHIIEAMIPDRTRGTAIEPELREAVSKRTTRTW